MGRITFLGDLIHAFTSNLYLYPSAFWSHYGNVKGFISGRFWRGDPVPKTGWIRSKVVCNYRIDLPGQELFIGRITTIDDPNGKFIVDLIKSDILIFHFPPDGENGFRPALDGVLHVFLIQGILDHLGKLINILILLFFTLAYFLQDIVVHFRFCIFKTQVLKFGFNIVKANPVGQGSIDIESFRSYFLLLVCTHRIHRLHIVQAVGDLDDNYPYVII